MIRFLSVFGGSPEDRRLRLETARFVLRPPRMEDFESWAKARSESRAFLTPWEPTWPSDDLTRASFRRRLDRIQDEAETDTGYAFLIVEPDAGARVLGGITLGNVRRRAAQMASLGYWMSVGAAGRGIMTEAVSTLVPHAFSVLRLERIEAACLPENIASVRVLEKAGFQREGLARDYLAINGRRCDHALFARLARDPAPVIPAIDLSNHAR